MGNVVYIVTSTEMINKVKKAEVSINRISSYNFQIQQYENYSEHNRLFCFMDICELKNAITYLLKVGKRIGVIEITYNIDINNTRYKEESFGVSGNSIINYAIIQNIMIQQYIIRTCDDVINYSNKAIFNNTNSINQPSIQNKVQSQPVQYNQAGQQSITNQQTNNKDKDFGVLSGIRINIDVAILFFIVGWVLHGMIHKFQLCGLMCMAVTIIVILILLGIKYKKEQ